MYPIYLLLNNYIYILFLFYKKNLIFYIDFQTFILYMSLINDFFSQIIDYCDKYCFDNRIVRTSGFCVIKNYYQLIIAHSQQTKMDWNGLEIFNPSESVF